MAIQFACSCGRKLQAQDEHAGRRVKCPACGEEMTVPGADAAVQATEPAGSKPSPVQAEKARRSEVVDEEDDRPRRSRREREEDEDDEEDRPRRRRRKYDDDDRPRADRQTSGKATGALVLGFLSFCLNVIAAVPAVILALMSLADINRSRVRLGGTGMAIAGLLLACVGTLFSGAGIYFGYTGVREASGQQKVQNDFKQIGIAMHNYNDTYGHLPQAVPDPKVQPATKLSWRVQLLPYVEQVSLYNSLHQNEPWDSPHNKTYLTAMPKVFAHPKHPEEAAQGLTYYRVFVGPDTPFQPGQVTSIPGSFPDGTSNTILVVEAADPVPWTKPDEVEYDERKPLPRLGGHFKGLFIVGLADGSTRLIRSGMSEQTLRNAINPHDGMVLGPDW